MIELVIKIPEDEYQNILHTGKASFCTVNAIEAGTPLPKGHGRLIDADELKKIIQENDAMFMTGFSVRLCDINATPTIIEADKESEG